jgi:dihydroorotase
MLDLLIKGGQVFDESGGCEAAIAIAEGRIATIVTSGALPPAQDVIDATGKLIFPGLVDSHVHFRDPGLTHKEDFSTGTLAAAAGGVTTVMVMPTDNPFTLTPKDFSDKRALAEGRAHVDFALQAGLGPDRSQVRPLAELGAISFEIFMSDLPTSLLTDNLSALIGSLEAVRDAGSIAGVTPGNDVLFNRAAEIARREYGGTLRAFPLARPPAAEAVGIAEACIAASTTGARVHLRQVSSELSLRALQALRADNVSAEVTVHNLALTEGDYLRMGMVAKVAPPLRPQQDVDALRAAARSGALDAIATDHAPHHPDEKAAGENDVWKGPGGFPGVQTLLPVMLNLVERDSLSYAALVKLCCASPARLFGLYPRKGALQQGADADLVIVDPKRPMTIQNADQLSKARNTPFAGLTVGATPVLTLLRGGVIMREGKPMGSAAGRFLRP